MMKLKFHFAIFFILQISVVFSQQKQADSLLAVYNHSKIDGPKIDLLLEAASNSGLQS